MTRQQEGDEAAVKVCDHQRMKQIGVWSDAMYRCNPVLECLDCATEIYQGMPQPKLPATVQPEDQSPFVAGPVTSTQCSEITEERWCCRLESGHADEHIGGYLMEKSWPNQGEPEDETMLPDVVPDVTNWEQSYDTLLRETSKTIGDHRRRITALEAERDALKAEVLTLRLAYGLVLSLHGCGGDNCTEKAYLKDAEEMFAKLHLLRTQLDAVGQETTQDIWERGVIHGLTLAVDDIEDEFDPKMQEQTVAIRENISDLRFKKYTYTPPLKAGTE